MRSKMGYGLHNDSMTEHTYLRFPPRAAFSRNEMMRANKNTAPQCRSHEITLREIRSTVKHCLRDTHPPEGSSEESVGGLRGGNVGRVRWSKGRSSVVGPLQ